MFVDLHAHSTASDGTYAPADVVRPAHGAGLVRLALTDHDTAAGPAAAAPVPQLPAGPPTQNGTLHVPGYRIAPANDVLQQMTRQLIEARDNRSPQIIAALQRLGIDITMDEALAQAQGGVLGRPHIAALLVK